MRVLLVEPQYRKQNRKKSSQKKPDDGTLWYPPLGLMKLSRFHKDRGDEVKFVSGIDPTLSNVNLDLFDPSVIWDRVYITTLFTFNFDQILKTIKYYLDAVGGTTSKILVGGIMASIMPEEIFNKTGIYPITGVLKSPEQIRLPGDQDIDLLAPDYDLVDNNIYAINETYYSYTSRGCTNKCPWCGVPKIEPSFIPYIDIKPIIKELRSQYGDKPLLKLMDNNVLASPHLSQIVDDLLELGYGRNQFTDTNPKKIRTIDFNQGLDASFLNKETMDLLSKLNIRPMRIAFDRLSEKNDYENALELANSYGVEEFSNYMLFNFNDTPKDLYERLCVNIDLNEKWIANETGRISGKIYNYPMRYAPISDKLGNGANRKRDLLLSTSCDCDWLENPKWTRRFLRNIEIMKGAAHGAISPTPSLARRTIGFSFEEFIANLYMPEELLRNRNKHEKRIYEYEPDRKEGSGKVEEFRSYVIKLIKDNGIEFKQFHDAVSPNSVTAIRTALNNITDPELRSWLNWYLPNKKK